MNPNAILYPVFGMFLLTAAILTRLAILRVGAVRGRKIKMSYFRFYSADGSEDDSMFFTSRNFINLFELPVLFYVVTVLIYVTGTVEFAFVLLAWLYVILRSVHSYLHVTSNYVPRRFNIYMMSALILLALWGKLAFHVIVLGEGGA